MPAGASGKLATATLSAIESLAGMWEAFDAAQRVVIPEHARTSVEFQRLWGVSQAGAHKRLQVLVEQGRLRSALRHNRRYYWPTQ